MLMFSVLVEGLASTSGPTIRQGSKVMTQAVEVMAAFLLKGELGQFYGGCLGLGRLWLLIIEKEYN